MINNYALIAINAKYIHSNLAVKYIKGYLKSKGKEINILEFSINDNIDKVLYDIYLTKYNVFAFSCYIWNIEFVTKICKSLKKVLPTAVIILGGPEASYEINNNLDASIDYIICGEGEITFYELVKYLEKENNEIESIDGLIYKSGNGFKANKSRDAIINLDIIPFPYDDISNYKNKIIYYETSRGCPYRCSYCLSSLDKSVRYFSLARVFKNLDFFIDNKVKQVKFVDRTFNCDKKRCIKIMDYIIEKKGVTNFHFEISAKLIDEAFLSVVKKAPKGLFQFEIGIQSTNLLTLEAIKRNEPFDTINDNIKALTSLQLSHIHLDLIAGLPLENIRSFEKSFNDAYSLHPDMLQLGFLKLLKGSGLRKDASKYNILYRDYPPYEVLSTEALPYADMMLLKNIEKYLNTYYNSGKFINSIFYLEKNHFDSPFNLYLSLYNYYSEKKYDNRPLNLSDLFSALYDFVAEKFEMTMIFNELLKLDYFISLGTPIPDFFKRLKDSNFKNAVNSFMKNNCNIEEFMPELKHLETRQRFKCVEFEVFFLDVIKDFREIKTIVFKIINFENKKESRILSMDLDYFYSRCDSYDTKL